MAAPVKKPAKPKRRAGAKKPAARKKPVVSPPVKSVEPPPPPPVTPSHRWTNGGAKVLIIKAVDKDLKAYGGFQWPAAGEVNPEHWKPDTECGNGLHGWAWGLAMGEGKAVNFIEHRWIVFEANPDDVILLAGGKVKARTGNVIYSGAWVGAQKLILPGQIAWIQYASRGSASATGDSGSASATGNSGSASATGSSGSASATGNRGSASATGYSGSASATGSSGSASATGNSGSASATGDSGSASATGNSGSASATGSSGSASATGNSGSASATGSSGSASATGNRGSASATGDRGSASATGYSGSASATGYRGSASATGDRGVAVATRDYSTLEVSGTGLAVTTAEIVFWRLRKGAVLAQRNNKGSWLVEADKLNGFNDGDLVQVTNGQVTRA